MKARRLTLVLLIGLISTVLLGSSGLALAAPAATREAPVTSDFSCPVSSGACTSVGSDTSSSLRLQASLGEATYAGILRFNVSGASITAARLNLAYGYAGSCLAENVNIQVYSTTDDSNSPQRGTLLASIDGGTATVPSPDPHAVSPAYQAWTDTTPADGLVKYLEDQRVADGVATLWVQETASTGSVFFASSNGGFDATCGTGAGGAYALGVPVLQLTDTPPLAVDVSSASAQSTSWPLYAGLGAVALFVVAGVVISRRRTA